MPRLATRNTGNVARNRAPTLDSVRPRRCHSRRRCLLDAHRSLRRHAGAHCFRPSDRASTAPADTDSCATATPGCCAWVNRRIPTAIRRFDEREGRNPAFDAQRTSANTNDLRGRALRITPQARRRSHDPGGRPVPRGAPRAPSRRHLMGLRNHAPDRVQHGRGRAAASAFSFSSGRGRGPTDRASAARTRPRTSLADCQKCSARIALWRSHRHRRKRIRTPAWCPIKPNRRSPRACESTQGPAAARALEDPYERRRPARTRLLPPGEAGVRTTAPGARADRPLRSSGAGLAGRSQARGKRSSRADGRHRRPADLARLACGHDHHCRRHHRPGWRPVQMSAARYRCRVSPASERRGRGSHRAGTSTRS
jgi:hypothetical protein